MPDEINLNPTEESTMSSRLTDATIPSSIDPKIIGEQMDKCIERKKEASDILSQPEIPERPIIAATKSKIKYRRKVASILHHPYLPPVPDPADSIFASKHQLDEKSTIVWNFIKNIR